MIFLILRVGRSRDFSAWMSGWLSYQICRTFVDALAHQKNIANLKALCQYHPQDRQRDGWVSDWLAVKCWSNGE